MSLESTFSKRGILYFPNLSSTFVLSLMSQLPSATLLKLLNISILFCNLRYRSNVKTPWGWESPFLNTDIWILFSYSASLKKNYTYFRVLLFHFLVLLCFSWSLWLPFNFSDTVCLYHSQNVFFSNTSSYHLFLLNGPISWSFWKFWFTENGYLLGLMNCCLPGTFSQLLWLGATLSCFPTLPLQWFTPFFC